MRALRKERGGGRGDIRTACLHLVARRSGREVEDLVGRRVDVVREWVGICPAGDMPRYEGTRVERCPRPANGGALPHSSVYAILRTDMV